jgi:hypothetical protein
MEIHNKIIDQRITQLDNPAPGRDDSTLADSRWASLPRHGANGAKFSGWRDWVTGQPVLASLASCKRLRYKEFGVMPESAMTND